MDLEMTTDPGEIDGKFMSAFIRARRP
jgi:hypothetical protein